jgi:hypothetical protein
MKTKKVKLSEIKMGPIRQVVLPDGFIVRVQKYKEILKEVETSTIEEAISNFQRDLYPETELLIWESIAHCYKIGLETNPKWSIATKKKVFSNILKSTLS